MIPNSFKHHPDLHRSAFCDYLRLGNNNQWNTLLMELCWKSHRTEYPFLTKEDFNDQNTAAWQREVDLVTEPEDSVFEVSGQDGSLRRDFKNDYSDAYLRVLDYLDNLQQGYVLATENHALTANDEWLPLYKHHTHLHLKIFKSIDDIIEQYHSLEKKYCHQLHNFYFGNVYAVNIAGVQQQDEDAIINLDECYDDSLQQLHLPSEKKHQQPIDDADDTLATHQYDDVLNDNVIDFVSDFYHNYNQSIDLFIIYTLKKWCKVNAGDELGVDLVKNMIEFEGEKIPLQQGIIRTLKAFEDYHQLAQHRPNMDKLPNAHWESIHENQDGSIELTPREYTDEEEQQIAQYDAKLKAHQQQLQQLQQEKWRLFAQIQSHLQI